MTSRWKIKVMYEIDLFLELAEKTMERDYEEVRSQANQLLEEADKQDRMIIEGYLPFIERYEQLKTDLVAYHTKVLQEKLARSKEDVNDA